MKIKLIPALVVVAAALSIPSFAQSGGSTNNSGSTSGPGGNNVDNVTFGTVGNIITVTISSTGGVIVINTGGLGGNQRGGNGASAQALATVIAQIDAAIAQISLAGGSGAGPAVSALLALKQDLTNGNV